MSPRIVITGAAGLVGQNLIIRLREAGYRNVVGIDKHAHNVGILEALHPDVDVIEADLAVPGRWREPLQTADVLILAHAQIGGLSEEKFIANNVTATRNVLAALDSKHPPYLIHLSSSVVNSLAVDYYTETKKQQESLVEASGFRYCILRPTLMFGWFDRKHIGWLARFMRRSPVFPVPGHGQYLRQPLYVQDFCSIVLACITERPAGRRYNISGQKKTPYLELIRKVKRAARARTLIVKVPYRLFWLLLRAYALIDRDPPFTTKQLEALVTPDEFEVIDWPGIFDVASTPLDQALEETFNHPKYAAVTLAF